MTDTSETPRKPGRKRGGSARSVTFTFRATPAEAEKIRESAGTAPLSEWLRETALHSRDALQMLAEVHKKISAVESAAIGHGEIAKMKERELSALRLTNQMAENQRELASKIALLAETVASIQSTGATPAPPQAAAPKSRHS